MRIIGIFDNALASIVSGQVVDYRNSVTTTYADTNYIRGDISLTSFSGGAYENALYCEATPTVYDVTPAGGFWWHFEASLRAARMWPDVLAIAAADSSHIWRVRNTSTGSIASLIFEVLNEAGSVTDSVTLFQTSSFTVEVRTFDLRIDPSAFELKMYINGTLTNTWSLDLARRAVSTEIAQLVLIRGPETYFDNIVEQHFSQPIFASEQTVGWKLAQLGPNAAGTVGGADFTPISETGFSTASINTHISAGSFTFGYDSLPDLQTISDRPLQVAEVFVGTIARADESGSFTNVTNIAYIGGAQYDIGSATDVEFNEYAASAYGRSTINPATGIAWEESDFVGIEFGYKLA